jgi:hypothetical protein
MMAPRRTLAALAAGTCALTVAACGSSDSKDKSSSTRSTRSTPTTARTKTARPLPIPPPPVLAKLGTPQDVLAATSGGGPKTTLKVYATKYLRKLTPRFLQAPKLKGQRYVGVRLTLINVGQAPWIGSPARAATLITSNGTQATQVKAVASCGGPFGAKVQLVRGERQTGCLAWILKEGERPGHLQFAPDSPATPPVEWSLTT